MTFQNAKPPSVEHRIKACIQEKGRGVVFVPTDFLNLGSRSAIDVALHRLVKKEVLQRLGQGVYVYPKQHPVLGALSPSADAVAKALAARDHARIQRTGASAANALGLSEQVPAKVVYLTDGSTHSIKIGSIIIQLRRTTPRNMASAGRLSGLLIQALRSIGRDHLNSKHIEHLKHSLPAARRRELLKDLRLAPAWMHPIFYELAENKHET